MHRFFYDFYNSGFQTNLFRSRPIDLDRWKKEFEKEWKRSTKKLKFEENKPQEHYLERGLLALQNFYAHEEIRNFNPPIYLEQRFSLEFEGLKLTGIIDRVDREPDGSLTVLDYKITDHLQTHEQLGKDTQLTMYHLACELSLARQKPNKLGLYYPLQNQVLYTKRSDEQRQSLMQKISEMNQQIGLRGEDASQYPASPAPRKCQNCAFTDQCPAYKAIY